MNSNKCVIVTGSSSGNGLSISEKLVNSGYTVYGVDLIPGESLSGEYIHFTGDLADLNFQKEVLDKVCVENIDISLVNNAGITMPSRNDLYPEEFWNSTISVNLSMPFFIMNRYAEYVKSGKIEKGAIVNITSLAAHLAFPENPAYIAAKHGLLGLTKYFALNLGQFNIRVNSVSPGYIRTKMTNNSYGDKERRELISNKSMLNRWGEPEEVAEAVSFLISEKSRFITGTDLVVDGGWKSIGLK